jgi:hypothetical protein
VGGGGKEQKKLVISAEDLSDADTTDADGAESATRELSEDPTEQITLSPKKAKAAPPPRFQSKGAATAKGAGPVGSPAAPPPKASWFSRNRRFLLLGAGLFGVLILAFLISFVVLGLFDTESETAREALTTASAAFERSTLEAQRAAQKPLPYTSLSEAATESRGRANTIGETITDLTGKVDEERLVQPTAKALRAEKNFLVQFARVAKFPESELEKSWRKLKPKLKASQRKINASREAVLALNLGDIAHLMPKRAGIQRTIKSTNRVILVSNQKVQAWRSEREAANAGVESAEAYKGEMSSLMEQYYEQRNVTQDLVQESHVIWTEAEQRLNEQAGERGSIIASMESLSVPPVAQSAHSQMVSLASQSKALLEEAAVRAAAPYEPVIWTGSPGWRELSEQSESITAQFGPAESAVLGAADQAISAEQAKVTQVGPRPQL